MWNLFVFELKHNIKNIYQYIYIYAFYVIILAIYLFAVPAQHASSDAGQALLLVAVVFSAFLLGARTIEDDYEAGYIDQLRLVHGGLEGYLFCKILILLLFGGVPALALVPFLANDMVSPQIPNHLYILLPVFGLAVIAITILVSSVTAGMVRARLLLGVIVMPWLVPLIVFTGDAVNSVSLLVSPAFWLLCGMLGVLLPVSLLLGAASLRE